MKALSSIKNLLDKIGGPAFVLALVVLVGSALGMQSAIRAYGLHLKKLPIYAKGGRTLLALPNETESWKQYGPDRIESAEVEETLGTKNYVSRTYVQKVSDVNAKPLAMEFHAAYYTGMIDTVPHVPDRCFVGGGWELGSSPTNVPLPLDRTRWTLDKKASEELASQVYRTRLSNEYGSRPGVRVRLPFDPQNIKIRVTSFLTPEGGELFAGYFFVANGGAVASPEGVRLLAYDLKSSYAYYLKIQVTSARVGSNEELAKMAASLLDELLGEIMLCVPDWVRVEQGSYPPPTKGKL